MESVADEIAKLGSLLDRRLITRVDFETMKADLLLGSNEATATSWSPPGSSSTSRRSVAEPKFPQQQGGQTKKGVSIGKKGTVIIGAALAVAGSFLTWYSAPYIPGMGSEGFPAVSPSGVALSEGKVAAALGFGLLIAALNNALRVSAGLAFLGVLVSGSE